MVRKLSKCASSIIITVITLGLIAQSAMAQQASAVAQMRGTWVLNSQYMKYQDGTTVEPYGKNVKGSLMLDTNGRYSFQVIGGERPKFKSGARREGTPEENAAAVFATETFFGTYTISEADQAITLHLERAILPNWDGVDRKYKFHLKGDSLSLEGPPSPSAKGPMIPFTDWVRAK